MKITESINRFISDLEKRNYSPSTLSTYQFVIESFDYSKQSVEDYVNRAGISPGTRNKELRILSQFFKYLIEAGIMDHNPASAVKPSQMPKKIPKTVNMKTMNTILDSITGNDFISIRDKALLEVAVSIAARTGDFYNLSIDNLNMKDGLIKVTGKGSKEMIQHLSDAAISSLKRYLAEREKIAKCNSLFVNNKGEPLKAIYYIFKKYLRNIKPHDFNRHSMAIILLRNGMKMHELREVMRHSNISTTSRYLSVTREDLKDAFHNAHPRNE